MQTNANDLSTSLQSALSLGIPIEIGDIKIVPAYRSLVTVVGFGAMAVVSPAALVVVQGERVEVIYLKDKSEREQDIMSLYQGG